MNSDCVNSGISDDIESYTEADALGKPGGHELTKKTALMSTSRYATEYNMYHKYRGIALVFNHETFDNHSLPQRKGTATDCKKLEETLKAMKFDVRAFHDLKLEEIKYHVEKVARTDHTHNDCLLIAILSHGEHGIIYAKDTDYKLDMICHKFLGSNCTTLAGKPKLFFIQACQGDQLDQGIQMVNNIHAFREETDGHDDRSFTIPNHADFLIAYSTIPGYYSWRNTTNGSWFIQTLCTELQKHGDKEHILTILTFVAQRVAIDYQSNTPANVPMHQQKQIPCVTSMLTRLLYFKK